MQNCNTNDDRNIKLISGAFQNTQGWSSYRTVKCINSLDRM